MRWGMAIDLKSCVGCNSCTLACKVENATPPEIQWIRVMEKEEGKYPTAKRSFFPLRCNHCADPPCLTICPTGATYQRDDGIVLVDYKKCIGCGACMIGCPYQVRFKWENGRGYYSTGYTPFEEDGYARYEEGTCQKCTFCSHRLDQGLPPACVQTCPTRALTFGDLDDPDSELNQVLRARHSTRPREELGTQPSTFYLT